MTGTAFDAILAQYHGWLSLYAGLGILAVTLFGKLLLPRLVPAFGRASRLNRDTLAAKMAKPSYAANQLWNRKWSGFYLVIIFGMILPFCLTVEEQPWWRMPVDIVVILMVYDFFYYLMHRFLFHDGGSFRGPLQWMHAVHHRQHNPCRADSSYIHPLEIALGLGLYVATIFVLSRFMGHFHVATVVITWVAFSEINLHNHDRWEETHFPFGYLNTMSVMHHNHHARFTGGNFATITLFYDWLFGTLDHGEGYGKRTYKAKAKAEART
ncbi:MAG: sterol desaturase family protein [Sphingobium sp.]